MVEELFTHEAVNDSPGGIATVVDLPLANVGELVPPEETVK